MIKKKAAIGMALVLACASLSLSGCHGTKGMAEFHMPEQFDTTRDYEITFWAKNDTNKSQTDIYNKAVEDFQRLYPNITVTIKLYTDYSRIYNDVITNISTDTTPNVCITYPDHIATYMTGHNTVVALDELLEDERWGLGGSELRYDGPTREEIVPQFLQEGVIGDRQYAIPYMRSTESCYVNKTYVEKLGYELPEVMSWDYIWEVSEAAMEQNSDGTYKVNGQKVLIPFIYKSTDNMMIQYLTQAGAGYSDGEGNIGIFNDTQREFLETIYSHAKSGAFSTFKISSYPANFLNAGQCIFAIDSTAGATWMGSEAPLSDISADQFVQFETAVMPIPQLDVENPRMISQGPSICVFNKSDPQEVLAGWLFVQYLLTNDVQIAYSETEGYVPVTLKAQKDPAYLDYLAGIGEDTDKHYEVKIKASQLLMDNTANTFVTPVFNGSTSLRDAAGQMIENVSKSARRGETVDSAYMENLQKSMISLYRLDSLSSVNSRGNGAADTDLGEYPASSKGLLAALVAAWIAMAAVVILKYVKSEKR